MRIALLVAAVAMIATPSTAPPVQAQPTTIAPDHAFVTAMQKPVAVSLALSYVRFDVPEVSFNLDLSMAALPAPTVRLFSPRIEMSVIPTPSNRKQAMTSSSTRLERQYRPRLIYSADSTTNVLAT